MISRLRRRPLFAGGDQQATRVEDRHHFQEVVRGNAFGKDSTEIGLIVGAKIRVFDKLGYCRSIPQNAQRILLERKDQAGVLTLRGLQCLLALPTGALVDGGPDSHNYREAKHDAATQQARAKFQPVEHRAVTRYHRSHLRKTQDRFIGMNARLVMGKRFS